MYAVGIDVSKGFSTVAILQPGNKVVRKPFNVPHTDEGLDCLVAVISGLGGETKAAMECTGSYHEPVLSKLSEAGIFTAALNPKLIKDFDNGSLRKVKTDRADSRKIARYVLDKWVSLCQYMPMDDTRTQLKALNRQFGFYQKQRTAMRNTLRLRASLCRASRYN